MLINVPVVPLHNLRIIHGEKYIEPFVKYSVVIHAVSPYTHQSIVDLRSLISVRKGRIFLGKNYICYLNKVNWRALLDEDEQSVEYKADPVNCSSTDSKCDTGCPLVNGTQYCWGPGKKMCQKINYCNSSICAPGQSCFFDTDGEARCCHEECEKGCSGPSASECFACRNFRYRDQCLSTCSEVNGTDVDLDGNSTVSEPYEIQNLRLCVTKCTKVYMTEGRNCVEKCSPNYFPQENLCRPCENDTCDAVCRMETLAEDVFKEKPHLRRHFVDGKRLFRSLIKKLRNCSTVIGDIVLDLRSLLFDKINESVRDEDLQNLRNIRILNGHIRLILMFRNVRSLDFLSNLESITSSAMNRGLEIFDSKVEYLALKRLRQFNAGFIWLYANPKLCYLEKLKNRFPNVDVQIQDSKSIVNCIKDGQMCSSDCDSNKGCWGPGSDMCYEQETEK